MQILLFTVVAIAVYVISDGIVRAIERNRPESLQNRQLIFFIVFFGLILVAFELLKRYAPLAA